MTNEEKELYSICKKLELYKGYTEGVMDLVEDSEEDLRELLNFHKRNPQVNESDFLGYAMYLNIKRTEPERIIEDD